MLTVTKTLLMMMVVTMSSLDPASSTTSPSSISPNISDSPITCYVCYNCLTYEQVQLRQCNATAGEHWCLVRPVCTF